jgi:hypothetical protein
MRQQLAQVNVARLVAPIEHPDVQEFAEALDPINALADASPGFVWRLQDDTGSATGIRIDDDERVIVNLSVWTDVDALIDFVYKSEHSSFLRRRRERFERFGSVSVALWWVPEGHRPTVDEALMRLDHLERHGPTPTAFTFRTRFESGDTLAASALD